MANQISWTTESDQILKLLYVDKHILNWSVISQELNSRFGLQANPLQYRNRFVQKYGIIPRDEWTKDQEKELYRLHNQNGNKWVIISQNLLGRNDNCVKNHFYSKLRKSLRTINKIAKLYLKKQIKQISDLVLYKLTEVTDQSLKHDTDLSKKTIEMSLDIKNKLLNYQLDQKEIKEKLNYSYQKQLLLELDQFNKIYKKKSKKQKVVGFVNSNLKKNKKHSQLFSQNQVKKQQIQYYYSPFSQYSQKFFELKGVQTHKDNEIKQEQLQKFPSVFYLSGQSLNYFSPTPVYICHQLKPIHPLIPKTILTVLIKEPNAQQKLSQSNQKILDLSNINPTVAEPKTKNKVEDILKSEGLLQNLDQSANDNHFPNLRRSKSLRSFSFCSETSNAQDMSSQGGLFVTDLKQKRQFQNSRKIIAKKNTL